VAVVVEVPEVVELGAEADPVVEVPDVPEPEVLEADPADPADPVDPADPADVDACAAAGAGVTFGVGNGVCNET
jgi:hypothetical protein